MTSSMIDTLNGIIGAGARSSPLPPSSCSPPIDLSRWKYVCLLRQQARTSPLWCSPTATAGTSMDTRHSRHSGHPTDSW